MCYIYLFSFIIEQFFRKIDKNLAQGQFYVATCKEKTLRIWVYERYTLITVLGP